MIAVIRRLWVFMGLSALLNLAALALVGHFWRPLPPVPPLASPKMMLLTLLPTARITPALPKPRHPMPKPPPRQPATPLPPTPHRPVQVSPTAARAGGGVPAPRPKPRPKPASQFHVLAPATPQTDIPQAIKTVDSEPPDAMDAADGVAPPTPDPGPARTPDPGKANTEAPGVNEAAVKGSGTGAGTGDGSGSGNGTGKGTGVGLFGTHDSGGGGGTAPRHIVYVLDISGSMDMTEEKFHGKRRIEQARDELTKQFQTLSDGETFSVVAFSDDVRLFRRELVKADPDTLRDARHFLTLLTPNGGTDLENALKVALAMPGVNVIAVITDGVPNVNASEPTPEDFKRLVARIHAADTAQVPIYTYGLLGPNPDGTDDTPLAASLLTRLAADSGGKFVEVKLDGEGP